MQSNSKLCDIDNEYNVLDIASGLPFVATKSLVPESINKNCLRDAKVLQQVDKKFIPIVAGGTLAIIDQVLYLHILYSLNINVALGMHFLL